MERVIKTKIKRLDETSISGGVAGERRLPGLDTEAPWKPIKYYPETDTKETFMKRCLSVRGSKNIKEPKDKAIELCALLWTEFTANENITTGDINPAKKYSK